MLKKIDLFLLFLILAICVCGNAEAAGSGVFHSLADKTGKFAVELRKFAYVVSGFGIIMFTYLAICGKINFKHLGYIILCLFFLAGLGSMIVYIKGGNSELTYEFKDTYTKAGEGRSSSL